MNLNKSIKVDFHLHSYASNVTDYFAANSFAIPESYSDPFALYAELKSLGMSLVTLTDHNSIDGIKALLDRGYEDVFISAEMTTTFPEDGCNIHVTVANMTESQFGEINRLRGNIYEMLDYVDRQIAGEDGAAGSNRLAYFMTHPLMSTQNRPYGREGSLSLEHIEKALLLINAFEVRNGTRTRALNEFTHTMIRSLTPQSLEKIADKHGITPKGLTPWNKAVLGGSDDHSGINPGRTWTEFSHYSTRRATANDVVEAIRTHRTRPMGQHGGPMTLAHAMLKLLHDGRKQVRSSGTRTIAVSGPVNTLLQMVFDPSSVTWNEKVRFRLHTWLQTWLEPLRSTKAPRPFEQVLSIHISRLVSDKTFLNRLRAQERTDDKIFLVVSTLVDWLFMHYARRIANSDVGNFVCVIKELVALISSHVFVSLPYLLAYLHQSSDRLIVRDVRKAFAIEERQRLVLVTDTFFDINGVSRTIRRMMAESRRRGISLTVVTCLTADEYEQQAADPEIAQMLDDGRLKIFVSVCSLDIPRYTGLKIHFPPFLSLLKYLQEEGFTKMQISTPGTMGVAGLMAAKVLQIDTASTYHTSFPEYVEDFTKDISLEALTWKYMIFFYQSVDEVIVPSRFIAKLLHERGLRNRSLLVLDRWTDSERFHPRHRTTGYWTSRGVSNAEAKTKFVYVGRVSIEKNLNILAQAFRKLVLERSDVHLIIIGDGPYRSMLEAALRDLPCTFTGMLEGAELSRAIASCDAKLFPSTTDTWGNAPLEAQASGLPVVVSDMGGPQELMIDGVTGFRVRGRDVGGLTDAMRKLCEREVREQMGRNARLFVEENRIEEPFTAILDSPTYRNRAKQFRREKEFDLAPHGGKPEVISTVPAHFETKLAGSAAQ